MKFVQELNENQIFPLFCGFSLVNGQTSKPEAWTFYGHCDGIKTRPLGGSTPVDGAGIGRLGGQVPVLLDLHIL